MATVTFSNIPPQFANVEGTVESLDDGRVQVTIAFDPAGGKQTELSSGTDVVVVLDASFSMYAGAYRNAKIIDLVDKMITFMSPYDDDGIDVYTHSLRTKKFEQVGGEAHASADTVIPLLGDFMEARTALRLMGQSTYGAPVLDHLIQEFKEEKGSDRLFIEMITDGEFDDWEAVEEAILKYGKKYNIPGENEYAVRFHFTGVGAKGAKGLEFLSKLDHNLEGSNEGFIDCVQHDNAATVEAGVESILRELQKTVKLDADNAYLSISGAEEPSHISDCYAGDWKAATGISFEGGIPIRISVALLFESMPKEFAIELQYVNGETDQIEEYKFNASVN